MSLKDLYILKSYKWFFVTVLKKSLLLTMAYLQEDAQIRIGQLDELLKR